MTVQERLYAYIAYKQFAVKDFERTCGLGNGTASTIGENTRERTFDRISKGCPDLNIDWLRWGNGEMLHASSGNSQSAEGDEITQTGNNSYNVTNSTELFTKALDEIAAQRRLTEQTQTLLSDAQATIRDLSSQLINLIQKIQK